MNDQTCINASCSANMAPCERPRRPRGTGTIHAAPGGGFWPRMPGRNGERLERCATWDDAERLLDAALAEVAEGKAIEPEGYTLEAFGLKWIKLRETNGIRSADDDESRFNCHIATASFASWPLKAITKAAIRDWLDDLMKKRVAKGNRHSTRARRKLGRRTVMAILNLLRGILQGAVDRELLDENPARDITLPRGQGETHDPWTWLMPDEQAALLQCEEIPRPDRLIIAFAIGTGLRQNEVWLLELKDVVVNGPTPQVVVRYGSVKRGKKLPPKNGKIRRVPLFGLGLEAMKAWLQQLADFLGEYKSEHGLVFPTSRGCRRQQGKPAGGQYLAREAEVTVKRIVWRAEHRALIGDVFWRDGARIAEGMVPADAREQLATALAKAPKFTRYRWSDWLESAGLAPGPRHDGRPVRWHDLRHTCASSLVAGWWGRRWSLEEVRKVLGHSSITVTERYAHLADSALADAARATVAAPQMSPRISPQLPAPSFENAAFIGAPPAGIGPATFGLGTPCLPEEEREVDRCLGDIVATSAKGLAALSEGGPFAWARATAALTESHDRAGATLAARAARRGKTRSA